MTFALTPQQLDEFARAGLLRFEGLLPLAGFARLGPIGRDRHDCCPEDDRREAGGGMTAGSHFSRLAH